MPATPCPPVRYHIFKLPISLHFHAVADTPPHFHVRYGSQKALVAIDTLSLLRGGLSPRVRGLVVEWASQHQVELAENWSLARRQQPLQPIQPLE
jgi:hypothetical protein